jgi:3-isopropylmalate/(R)-2-methylmalate dehydratase large subunit
LGEKILARRWVVDAAEGRIGVPAVKPGDEGFVLTDLRFSHEYVTPMAAIFFEQLVGADQRINDPASVLFFRDHLTFLPEVMTPERVKEGLLDVALQLEKKQRAFAEAQGVRLYGELRAGVHGSEAICHSKILESHAEPGQVIIGSDSHTPHAGAVGCVAFGVGTTAIFNSWITRDVRVTVPQTVKVEVHGRKPDNVTAKDFMLEILRHPYVKNGHAIGKLIEYSGDAVEALSVDERATMTNMTAEVGGFTGYVAPDGKTVDYLVGHRGMAPADAERLVAGLRSDADAEYCEVIEIDAGRIRPMMALPGDPGNGMHVAEADSPVRVDIAYAGSCTAGKKEDMDMYARVLAEAAARGARVAPWVRFFIQCGSQDVKRYCEERGYLDVFRQVGATFLEPSCGACINAGPGVSRTRDEVTISAINRNFPGRSGPGQLYLANPYTVAASAISGYITEWKPGGTGTPSPEGRPQE